MRESSPIGGGVFIDAYNQHINESIAMTITTRVNTCNHYYVTEPLSVAMRGRNPKNPSEQKKVTESINNESK